MTENPSKQTDDWDQAGAKASTNLQSEQQKAAASVPEYTAEMEGKDAGGKGAASGGGAKADVNAKGEGADPQANPPPAKDAPPPPEQSGETSSKLASVGENKDALKTQGQEVISGLKTSDPNLKTDPGPSPVVELSGASDPAATAKAEGEAKQKAGEELQKQKDKILAGPGAAQVQPIKIEQKLKITPNDMPVVPMPTLPPVEGMGKLKGWSQHTANASIKGGFDNIAKPKLDASIGPAKDKVAQAATEKDQKQQKAIDETKQKVAQANADAQSKQTQQVASTRTQIATAQQDTLNKQKTAVSDLESKASAKRSDTVAKVDARVQADQSKIQSQYTDAQKQADDKQKQAEEEAKQKKEEAEAKSKEGSWWDRAVSAVTSAIKEVASAIDGILTAVRDAVGKIIDTVKNAACAIIDAAASFITSAISAFGDWLKEAINATLGQLFPELAAALNSLIDSAVAAAKKAVNFLAEQLKKAVTAFFDGLKASFNALIAGLQAAVQAAAAFATALVTGDWSAVGKMLLEAVLKLCGIDPGAFYALVGQAEDTIKLILDDPAAFAGHVVDAVKLGFQQFGGNFWNHLKAGVVNWLFGTLGDAGITMPSSFDIKGIFDLACQILGLTYPKLRAKAVKLIGEKNVERIEFIWKYIEAFLTGGWAGLWEKVQQDLGMLWDMVIDGVKSYLIETIVKQAIMKVATMWNPAGAIIQLLITAWNVYCWVKENAQRIFGLIQAVVQSMSNIAHGNISGAANYIEQSLAKLIPIAISFLADLLGLGGIADKIKETIGKVQAFVDKALDNLIDRVLKLFKGDKSGPGAAPPSVPTAIVEPSPASVSQSQIPDALQGPLSEASSGTVVFNQGGSADEAAKRVMQKPGASMNESSKVLSLPPVNAGALAGQTSVQGLGQALGAQLGVSKITLKKEGKNVSFSAAINPEVDNILQYLDPKQGWDKTDFPKVVGDASADGEWTAKFGTAGKKVMHADPGGSPMALTFEKVWGDDGLSDLILKLEKAIKDTVGADAKKVADYKAIGFEWEKEAIKRAAQMVNAIKTKEVCFIKPTDMPRYVPGGDLVVVNDPKVKSEALYQGVAEKAGKGFLEKMEGELHHVIPLYLGGGNEATSLVWASGTVSSGAHGALHAFINTTKISKWLSTNPNKPTLKYWDIAAQFPGKILDVLIGVLNDDGSIKYKTAKKDGPQKYSYT
jgi:hypothetical protein